MSLNDVLTLVNKTFKPRRKVDFEDVGLHIELEPLTSLEEVKVTESVKDAEGAEYMEALRRNSLAFAIKQINDVNLDGETITYDSEGKKVTKSKFLYMQDYLGQWPSSILENLFGVFSNVVAETEDIITKKMKHEAFILSAPVAAEEPPKPGELRLVKEKDEPEDDAEVLRRRVEKEGTDAQARMDDTLAKAEEKKE